MLKIDSSYIQHVSHLTLQFEYYSYLYVLQYSYIINMGAGKQSYCVCLEHNNNPEMFAVLPYLCIIFYGKRLKRTEEYM